MLPVLVENTPNKRGAAFCMPNQKCISWVLHYNSTTSYTCLQSKILGFIGLIKKLEQPQKYFEKDYIKLILYRDILHLYIIRLYNELLV